MSLQSPDLMGTLSLLAEFGEEAGARLRAARERAGMTQFEAAMALGIKTDKTIGRWESGHSKPQPRQWRKIEEVYGVTVVDILGEPEPAQLDRIETELRELRQLVAELLHPLSELEQRHKPPASSDQDPSGSDTPEDPGPPSP